MTSGISFHKLVRENMWERKWLPFLIAVSGIFFIIIGYYFVLGDIIRSSTGDVSQMYEWIAYRAESYIGTRSAFLVTLALIAAILAGYSGYLWLHAQEQVDFYNSTAVKRSRLFSAIFTSGALQVIVPFVICDLAAVFLMPAARGVFTWHLVGIGVRGMAFAILVFLCLYSFVVLAVVLSARIITTVLMTALLWLYGPIMYALLEALRMAFFDTLVSGTSDSLPLWLSPAFLAFGAAGDTISHAGACLGILIYGAAAFAASMAAYCVRPSEAAGNAFAFRLETTIVKCMILVPSSLGIGMLLGGIAVPTAPVVYTTSSGGGVTYSSNTQISVPWMAFGLLFGAFLMHTVLELLFQPDFRNIRRHWKSGAVGAAISFAVYLFMVLDPMRINLWIPDKTDVQAMSMTTDIANPWLIEDSYYYYDYDADDTGEFFREYGALYDLAQDCVDSRAEGVSQAETDYNGRSIVIGYLLTNGHKAYRTYTVSGAKVNSVTEKLSESEEYRKEYYVTAKLPADFTDASLKVWDPAASEASESLAMNAEERKALIDALAQDSTAQTLSALESQTPVYVLSISGSEENYYRYYDIYIYPSYQNVLKQLAQLGGFSDINDLVTEIPTSLELTVSSNYDTGEYKYVTVSDKGAVQMVLAQLERETRIQVMKSGGTDISGQLMYADGSSQYMNFTVKSQENLTALLDEAGVVTTE